MRGAERQCETRTADDGQRDTRDAHCLLRSDAPLSCHFKRQTRLDPAAWRIHDADEEFFSQGDVPAVRPDHREGERVKVVPPACRCVTVTPHTLEVHPGHGRVRGGRPRNQPSLPHVR